MKKKKKHAPLQGSVRGYIREISVAMFLQIQTDIYIYMNRRISLIHFSLFSVGFSKLCTTPMLYVEFNVSLNQS